MPQTQYIKISLRLVNDESLVFNPQSNFMWILYVSVVYRAFRGLSRWGLLCITSNYYYEAAIMTLNTVFKLQTCNGMPEYEWFWFSFYFDFTSQLEIPLPSVIMFQRIPRHEHNSLAFGGVGDTMPSQRWGPPVTLSNPKPPDVSWMLIFQDASKYFIIDKNMSFSLFSLFSLPQFQQKKNIRQRAFANELQLQPHEKTAELFLLGVWFTDRERKIKNPRTKGMRLLNVRRDSRRRRKESAHQMS